MKFEHPQVLWLAVAAIPAQIGFLYWAWRVKQKLIQQFVHARLAPSLTAGVSPMREKVRLALLVAAVAGILCALARPQWGFAWEEAKQQDLDILVAIDASRSMLARDVAPNRIEKTKLAVIDLMRLAKSDRMGLVVFAGEAFLQAPLTLDDQAFQQAVEAASVGIVPVGGTSLSSAIRTSLQAFEKGNDNHKILVIFTDGEDHDADTETMAAAKEAAEAGLRIFTIGVGTPEGELLRTTDDQGNTSYIKDDEGNVVKSRLNEPVLRQIATEAGGFYLRLQGGNPMETLYARGLAPLPKSDETTRLTRVYQERYHWFLGFAVLCLMVEALLPERPRSPRRRGRKTAPALQKVAAALALLFIPLISFGSPSSAFRDYQSGDFKSAFDEYKRLAERKTNDYRLRYDAGASAYKSTNMQAAEEQFNAALDMPGIISNPTNQQRTYYNLGNTLYHLGESLEQDKQEQLWQEAITNYGKALRLNTNDADAKNNLAYVQKKLEQLKQQQQQQQQQQNKDQKDQKDKQQQQQQQNKDQKDQKQQQQNQKSDQQKKEEEKARQEQAKKEQEKKQQQAQASQGEKKDKQEEQGEQAAAELRMSPQEARKLLDEMKDDAKVLLFTPTNQPINTERGKFKDW